MTSKDNGKKGFEERKAQRKQDRRSKLVGIKGRSERIYRGRYNSVKKRMAAIMFVICVIMLIMLTAGFEQSDKLSTAEYLIYSALALGGMYISQKAAKKRTPAARRRATSVEKENVKLKTPIL